ncbi:MAG: hypothetical protein HY334_00515, partial [Armatimonadetes bacterium]|nr:hypothetical protein [Armatimonadota bacterium]
TALRIRYDPDLLESAVEHVLRQRREAGDRAADESYRRAADRIYALYDQPEARRAAFGALHARLFEEMGCGKSVAEAAGGVAGRMAEVLVTRAWTRPEEGIELGSDGRTLGVRILPARFASPAELPRFLRHEFGHVADMVDEAFGYGSGVGEVVGRMSRLRGDRFGLLWDCTIDGRAARAGEFPLHAPQELEAECARLYPALPPGAPSAVVRRLWEGERPTYATLVRWATDPAALAAWVGSAAEPEGGAVAPLGTPCPLCGFSTYAWGPAIDPEVEQLIQTDFPAWRRRDGACARCVEAYTVQREFAVAVSGSGPAR